MVCSILPVVIAITYAMPYAMPNIDLQVTSKNPLHCMKTEPNTILIADSHAGEDPHGPDPHGADPHDEFHDQGMPANEKEKERKAPTDPYGGAIPNTKEPY